MIAGKKTVHLLIAAAAGFAATVSFLRAIPATAPGPQFSDETAKSGIVFRTQGSPTSRKYLLESMGGGVAVLDYDGDGLLDLFFVNGASLSDPMPSGAVLSHSTG